MQRKVWTFQYTRDVRERGPDQASWYVGFYGSDGKRRVESCGPGERGRRKAERRSRQIEGQLEAGTYRPQQKTMWKEFRELWESKILPSKKPSTRSHYMKSLDHFERLMKPGRLDTITTQTIAEFIAARVKEGKRAWVARMRERARKVNTDAAGGEKINGAKHNRAKINGEKTSGESPVVSPATVNRDLRAVKVFLRTAHEWEKIPKVPRIRMVKEPRREIRTIPAERFNAMFEAAAGARYPKHAGQNYSAGDWWQALLATAYMTGMRIGELLALRWEDVDLDAGTLRTRAEDNKSSRDETLPLHPAVVGQLKRIRDFGPAVFPWEYSDRTLYDQYHGIQTAAGITGRFFGFHDLRRSFGSIQATRVEAAVLKRLMRHSSVATTLKFYVNVDGALREAVDATPVPAALKLAQ